MKLEVRSQKSEVVFVMGIRATIQKHFALKVLALNPIILVNSVISYQYLNGIGRLSLIDN